MRHVNIELVITPEVDHLLDQLLPLAQEWTNPTTLNRPFKDYTKDQILQLALEFGNNVFIWERLIFLMELFGGE